MAINSDKPAKLYYSIKEVAEERNLTVIELHPVLKSRKFYTDGIHPNKDGAKMLAETVYKSLAEYSAQSK